jgi:glutamate-1-semialdehyde 2,1-aminomutase
MAWTNVRNKALQERARAVIPNGMYGHESVALLPPEFPQFYKRAKGVRLWDADDNEYIDFMCAFGPNLLGYGFEPVEAAAAAQQAKGDSMTGPSEIMVELAETMVGMVGHAEWAIFCKNGTDATSIAIVTARAQTGRRKILYAAGAYHGAAAWCTPRPAGILPEDRAHIVYYDYNDPQSLADAFAANGGDVAGVIATPFLHEVFRDQADPNREFALAARQLCDQHGAMLIVDEVRAGFRLARDCTWAAYGVAPDISTWGKCFANGYPISAVLGSASARKGAGQIFVTGSFWYGATAMAAALETLKQIRETDYLERLVASGRRLRDGLQQQAASHGFTLRQTGPVQMAQVFFEDDPDFRLGYGWAVEALKRGVYLHPYHNMFTSSAHSLDDIAITLAATDEAFAAVKARRGDLKPHAGLVDLLGQYGLN